MSFFVAQYRAVMIGDIEAKEFVKVTKLRHTSPRPLLINDVFPDEEALLCWLFEKLHVRLSDIGNKGPSLWRIATQVDVGTTNRRGGWDAPSWEEDQAVQLYQYKMMVHDADGKEKDARRVPLMYGASAKTAKQYLAVFAVHEHRLPEEPEAEFNDYSQPSMPRDRRQEQQPQPPPSLPLALASTSRQKAGPVSHTPLVYDLDDEDLFVAQRSSPVAPRFDVPPSSRLESVQSQTDSPNLATHGRRPSSTVASTVDLPNIALSSLAMCRPGAPDAVTGVGHQKQQAAGFDEQWIHSPDRDSFLQRTPNGGGSGFVRPADLEIEVRGLPGDGDGQVKGVSGAVLIEETEAEDVVALVPVKRKRPSPRTACADGKPKPKRSKKAGKSKKTAPPTQPAQLAMSGTRQSERIQARALSEG